MAKKRFATLAPLVVGLVFLFLLMGQAQSGCARAFAQNCILPPSGLVSWWSGDGNLDDIQDANTGTSAGPVAFTAGKVGQAFSFNGTSGSYITLPNNANLLPASNRFTIDAWIKPDFGAQNALDTVLAKRDGCAGGGASYYLYVIKFDPGFGGGHGGRPIGQVGLSMSAPSGPIGGTDSDTTLVPNDGQFHHVAGTYDGSAMKVYLDGQLAGETARTGPLLVTASAAVISRHAAQCPQRSVAAMDEIGFYDRALEAGEIQAIFQSGSAGKCKDGPAVPGVSHWSLVALAWLFASAALWRIRHSRTAGT